MLAFRGAFNQIPAQYNLANPNLFSEIEKKSRCVHLPHSCCCWEAADHRCVRTLHGAFFSLPCRSVSVLCVVCLLLSLAPPFLFNVILFTTFPTLFPPLPPHYPLTATLGICKACRSESKK